MASRATEPTPTTGEALEQTLRIAEDLIRRGKKQEGLSLVRKVNNVTEAETLRRSAERPTNVSEVR